MKIADLDFISKTHSGGTAVPMTVDVNCTVPKKGDYVYLSFSKRVCTMLGNPVALIAAKHNNCLYLCEQDENHGFKFAAEKHGATRKSVVFPNKSLKCSTEWKGWYPIRYDKESGLFFIALSDKNAIKKE